MSINGSASRQVRYDDTAHCNQTIFELHPDCKDWKYKDEEPQQVAEESAARKPDISINIKSGKLGEIYKRTMAAIEEHKEVITEEYKNIKRQLDLEQGQKHSEIKLARKERRSKKHIIQLEKAEYSTKKANMAQLHETLMRHHFSLSKVEEECMQALRDECIDNIRLLNRAELSLWKRACQDIHDTIDLPIKGFTVKKKCKRIEDTCEELTSIITDSVEQLQKTMSVNGIQTENGDTKFTGFISIEYLREVEDKINQQLSVKKKLLIKQWPGFGEHVKETLGKNTQLIKYQHNHRLELIVDTCGAKLREIQELAARRHSKLMQKVAREQDTLDKERTEMKTKHGERKSRSKRTNSSNDPSTTQPYQIPTMNNMMPGFGGGGGGGGMSNLMGGFPGMAGSFPGMAGGMRNFNMSNAVDYQSSQDGDNNDSRVSLRDTLSGPGNFTKAGPKEEAHLSELVVRSIPKINKHEIITRYLARQDVAAFSKTNSVAESATTLNDDDTSIEVTKSKRAKNRNVNADSDSGSSSSSSSGSSSSSSSSKKSKKGDGEAGNITAAKSKVGSIKAGSKKSIKAAYPKSGGDLSGIPDYEDFVENNHKDKKWVKRLKGYFSCCSVDNFVKKCCPCFRNRYEDYKERRAEIKERRKMRRNVLFRLRQEASRYPD